MKTSKLLLLGLIFTLLAVFPVPSATNVVTSAGDDGSYGTLRKIIASASAGDTILFTNTLSGATITLTNGELLLNQNLNIDGSALTNGISIDGNNACRIFRINAGCTNVLVGLNVTNGEANDDMEYGGGGILNLGNLTLTNCTLSGNTANNSYDGGGAIDSYGTLTVNQCTLTGNSESNAIGGAIDVESGTATVNRSTLSNNSANDDYGLGYGGGIAVNNATVLVNQSTLSSNSAAGGFGGGILSFGSLTVNQSTLSGNSAHGGFGGGIYIEGWLVVNQSTISGNDAGNAEFGSGGICDAGKANITNSIIADNATRHGANIYIFSPTNALNFGGENLLDTDPYNPGGTLNGMYNFGEPDLAPLGNYGGPTQTMPPLPDSPAIGNGSISAATMFATDQRGFPRSINGQVDIGAVELLPAVAITLAASYLDESNATLNACITANDLTNTWYFEYGLTTSYGSFSQTNTMTPNFNAMAVTNKLTGLAANTTYHYQVLVDDGISLKTGGDVTFNTLGGSGGTPPLLTFTVSDNQAIISWPSAYSGFTLQTNGDLTTGTWDDYGGPVADNGTVKSVTNATPTGILFFRLKQ